LIAAAGFLSLSLYVGPLPKKVRGVDLKSECGGHVCAAGATLINDMLIAWHLYFPVGLSAPTFQKPAAFSGAGFRSGVLVSGDSPT
jgi:hypothetical protein